MSTSGYRLVRGEPSVAGAPELDDPQRRVVDHKGGPLLVLAGPGTGKTTTLVETVVERINVRGVDPQRILVLTFSRKAAEELRRRISARLRRTIREPLAMTFHSYAYALIRRELRAAGEPHPRLLSGPEQLLELRELLAGEAADGAADWTEPLRAPLATRGFAEELRDFMMRAQERGIDPETLRRFAKQHDRDDWAAVADFMDRYSGRFDIAPVTALNYAELVRVAANLLTDPHIRAREQAAREIVLVDEYQDTDPAQEELLHTLAGDGRELIAVGDPDQAIYGFRGADVRGILEFGQRFADPVTGETAPMVALRTCRRSGPELLRVSRALAARLPAVPGVAAAGHSHRDLRPLDEAPDGECRVVLAENTAQEAAAVADELRRAHLIDGLAYGDMAVLVRSASRQIPTLRRALTAAGVPVTVSGDETPLREEPIVRALLLALRCALHPERLDEIAAHELLTGPLGGADTLAVRRLGRALRQLELDTGGRRRSAVLLAEALRDPRELTMVAEPVRAPAEEIARLLRLVADHAGESAEMVLWRLWQAAGLADRLQQAAQRPGRAGAAAERDLDAAVALFDAAARYCDRRPPGAPAGFLAEMEGHEIPGDTLAPHAPHDGAVQLLTAHRAKGLQWPLVVVAGVQEGHWPDTRLRGSLLGVDQLLEAAAGNPPAGSARAAAITSRLLDEERRLFYVALTRAQRRLLVSAVGGQDLDTEERPSRFLAELGVEPERAGGGRRSLTLPALVADLRSAVTDEELPEPTRRAAAAHLARLARRDVRGADPGDWYALTPWSDDRPLAQDGRRIRISPSQVETFSSCRLRWLLESAVGADSGGEQVAAGLGSVIHAVAVLLAEGTPLSEVDQRLDEVWQEMEFGATWYAAKERERAADMVNKLAQWQQDNPRELVAWEEGFRVEVDGIEITGRVDRLERDADGRAVIVDIKTGNSKVAEDELARHPQLGVYQLAVLNAAFTKYGLTEAGGAELIQAGKASLTAKVREQAQPALSDDPDPQWSQRLVHTVATGMSAGTFPATRNDGCRTCPVRSSCPAHTEGGRA